MIVSRRSRRPRHCSVDDDRTDPPPPDDCDDRDSHSIATAMSDRERLSILSHRPSPLRRSPHPLLLILLLLVLVLPPPPATIGVVVCDFRRDRGRTKPARKQRVDLPRRAQSFRIWEQGVDGRNFFVGWPRVEEVVAVVLVVVLLLLLPLLPLLPGE